MNPTHDRLTEAFNTYVSDEQFQGIVVSHVSVIEFLDLTTNELKLMTVNSPQMPHWRVRGLYEAATAAIDQSRWGNPEDHTGAP